MSEEIAKVIDVLAEKLAVPAQYVTQELLRYKLAEGIYMSIIGIVFFTFGLLAFKWGIANLKKDEYGELYIFCILLLGVISVILGLANCVWYLSEIVKILIAPTGYIITYILGALK